MGKRIQTFNQLREENRYLICADHYRLLEDLLKKEIDQYLLYHKNTYNNQMPFDQAMRGDYHRQRDVKPTLSLHKLINYIAAHDKAKIAIMEDYRKLPKSTAKQRKYYRQAEGKFKRLERKRR